MTSEEIARRFGGRVIRLNPREPEIDPVLGWGFTIGGLAGIERLVSDGGEGERK
jgi:hypothetical protein